MRSRACFCERLQLHSNRHRKRPPIGTISLLGNPGDTEQQNEFFNHPGRTRQIPHPNLRKGIRHRWMTVPFHKFHKQEASCCVLRLEGKQHLHAGAVWDAQGTGRKEWALALALAEVLCCGASLHCQCSTSCRCCPSLGSQYQAQLKAAEKTGQCTGRHELPAARQEERETEEGKRANYMLINYFKMCLDLDKNMLFFVHLWDNFLTY